MIPNIRRVTWQRTHRIIRSIYPPEDLFDDIAGREDWQLIAAAEAKTNERVRNDVDAIRLVPPERRLAGPGSNWVMAAFCHFSTDRPSRFSDGQYGIYYAGDRFEVALHETVHHFGRFMQATEEPAGTADYRELIGTIDADLFDLCGDERFTAALTPEDYGPGQNLARDLHGLDNNGIVYPSVRYPQGEAVAVFWPNVVTVPVQAKHLAYRWDGTRVDGYFIYGEKDWLPL